MRSKVQLIYKSGRTATVESERPLEELFREMTQSHWFLHSGGAENMLDVERIKPMSGAAAYLEDGPRRIR